MIYSLGFFIYMILAAPFYLVRVLRGRYRASFFQRLGFGVPLPPAAGVRRLWIHACSVGEVEAAATIVKSLLMKRQADLLIVSTVTETGQARAKALFPGCPVRYLPFDFLFSVRAHLDSAGPLEAFLIMETEIWPNLVSELARRKIPILIANGRISDRAWGRYRLAASLFRPILSKVSAIAARTELDAERFRFLGAGNISVTGNVKFDRETPAPPKNAPRGRFVIFASTHPGEEEIAIRIIRKLKKLFPELRAIIAPRHIERVAELLSMHPFGQGALRSDGWGDEDILILNTHGELAGMYALAEIAFIGGSFVPVGGHNPLEAAIHGVPTLWGPRIENFRDACGVLDGQGGFGVETEDDLFEMMKDLLENDAARKECGEAARKTVLANRGAVGRTLEFLGL